MCYFCHRDWSHQSNRDNPPFSWPARTSFLPFIRRRHSPLAARNSDPARLDPTLFYAPFTLSPTLQKKIIAGLVLYHGQGSPIKQCDLCLPAVCKPSTESIYICCCSCYYYSYYSTTVPLGMQCLAAWISMNMYNLQLMVVSRSPNAVT